MRKLPITLLMLLLTLSVSLTSAAPAPASQPSGPVMQQTTHTAETSAACASPLFSATPQETPPAGLFEKGFLAADDGRQTCQVFCVSSPCRKNSECTAAPGGTCNLVCPKNGCCVYP